MENITQKLAEQSRIDIPEDEFQWLDFEIKKQIKYLSILDDLQLEPLERETVITQLREDEVNPSMDRATLMRNTPNHTNDYFVLPDNSRT